MADLTSTSYNGNCHCGAIMYTVELSPPLEEQQVWSCNCSICTRNGYLTIHAPVEAVTFHQGKDKVKRYSFSDEHVSHCFCPTCGSSVFIEPRKGGWIVGKYALNVRMFQDVDLSTLKLKFFDEGKTMGADYKV